MIQSQTSIASTTTTTTTSSPSPSNILSNPSFSSGLEPWRNAGSPQSGLITTGCRQQSDTCLRYEDTYERGKGASLGGTRQNILRLLPAGRYQVRLWLKRDAGICQVAVFASEFTLLNVDSSSIPMGIWTQLTGPVVTTSYALLTNDFFVRGYCNFVGRHSVSFDDIEFYPV